MTKRRGKTRRPQAPISKTAVAQLRRQFDAQLRANEDAQPAGPYLARPLPDADGRLEVILVDEVNRPLRKVGVLAPREFPRWLRDTYSRLPPDLEQAALERAQYELNSGCKSEVWLQEREQGRWAICVRDGDERAIEDAIRLQRLMALNLAIPEIPVWEELLEAAQALTRAQRARARSGRKTDELDQLRAFALTRLPEPFWPATTQKPGRGPRGSVIRNWFARALIGLGLSDGLVAEKVGLNIRRVQESRARVKQRRSTTELDTQAAKFAHQAGGVELRTKTFKTPEEALAAMRAMIDAYEAAAELPGKAAERTAASTHPGVKNSHIRG